MSDEIESAASKTSRKQYKAGRLSWGSIREIRVAQRRKADGTMTKGELRYTASYLRKAPTDPPAGKRVYAGVSWSAKRDAEAWLAKQDALTQHGTVSPEPAAAPLAPVTFLQFATDYIDTRLNSRDGRELKPSTLHEYRRLLESQLREFHDLMLGEITPDAVRAWNSKHAKSGRRTQTARAYGLLRAVLAQAVADRRLDENPAQIRGAIKASTGKKVEPPTDAELAIIVATIDPRFSLMVEVAAWGSLRYGEITELRRGDLTFSDSTDDASVLVRVARAVTYTKSAGFVVGTPKSRAGLRTVALPPILTKPLRAHLATLSPADDALLWPSTKDAARHLHSGAFSPFWRQAREAADRTDMPFHALRHYGLTRYAQAGATTKDLLARAGHSDVTTMLRYQHAAAERDLELTRRMMQQ